MRLEDTTALVTGAAAGIGREIAAAFVAEGADVVAVDHAADRLQDAVETFEGPGSVRPVVADVREQADVERAVAEAEDAFGRLDLLVNNAGVKQLTLVEEEHPVHEVPVELWDTVLDTNLRGTFLFTRTALPGMLERGEGRILHITSGHGKHGRVNRAPYVASKHGAEGLHKSLSLELEGTGVASMVFTPPGGGLRTREAEITGPENMAHDADVVREPVVRLVAGEGENGGRYKGAPDGENFALTDHVFD
ncbi:MAG: SDR family NAD(P)-dependent oxidoreductase [Haloferacaceae archaeon]